MAFYMAPGGGAPVPAPPSTALLAYDKWVHVLLEVTFAAKGSLHVEIDKQVAHDGPFLATPLTTPIQLTLGLQRFNNATPSLTASFDAVRADVKKP